MVTQNQTLPKPTTKPPSPLAAAAAAITTNSPTRKRLLANPKQRISTTPSLQSSLSSELSDHLRKKTRDLPNLSDCHGCGLRINHTDPKDRLQTLESVWRIVLLCKKCIKQVELAEICPYCFDKTSELDCLKCRDCEKFVHKDCVLTYGKFPPWSYCHVDLQLFVCVDCWVPNLLANSIGVCRSKRNGNKKVGDSRVLVNNNNNNSPELLNDVVKDASFVVEKKKKIGVKAKDDATRKALVAKDTVALGNGVLGLVAKNDENGGKSKCLDDQELALQLHRAMNSSPRISKNLRAVNLRCLDVWKMGDSGIYGKVGSCSEQQLNEKADKTVSERSMCDSTNVKGKEHQENDVTGMADIVVGEFNSGVVKYYQRRSKLSNRLHLGVSRTQVSKNSTLFFYSRRNRKQTQGSKNSTLFFYSRRNRKQTQGSKSSSLFFYSRRNRKQTQGSKNSTLLSYSGCNRKCDRYLLTYTRRRMSSKAVCNGKAMFLYDGQTSAPGLPMNCSKELRKFSDAPSQSFDVPLQGFDCASSSSQEQP